MPQGRRKTPFSGKQKKQQLLLKRHNKSSVLNAEATDSTDESEAVGGPPVVTQRVNFQPSVSRRNANRYALSFHRETVKEIRAQREAGKKAIDFLLPRSYETGDEYFAGYDFPKRPHWTPNMTKEEVDRSENRYFTEYVKNVEKKHTEEQKEMSYFELNLETWRQLWRVLEISDIVLVIVDIRYPSALFPPSLYEYVTKQLNKNMIIVLNKIDLVSSHLALAWKHYFEQKYPNIRIVLFTAYPTYNVRQSTDDAGASGGLKVIKRRSNMRMAKEGAYQIQQACKAIVGTDLDISSWEERIVQEMQNTAASEVTLPKLATPPNHVDDSEFDMKERTRYQNNQLTVGCVGFPNVGKSSLMNALTGRKVVGVSPTPGKTKHFQTIFLTHNVRLCDCPGLVFPSSVPRKLQVLIGSYPIAQLREPFAAIRCLAERVDLILMLSIKLNSLISATEICDAWAERCKWFTAKSGRADTNKAANHILRMALSGKIVFTLLPPGFIDMEDYWRDHDDVADVDNIKALGISSELADTEDNSESDSDQEDDSRDEDSDNEDNSQDDDEGLGQRNSFDALSDEDDD